MIQDIKIRRITCDRCQSSFEYDATNEHKLKIHDKFVFLSSSSTDDQCTWDLCNTCYKSFINWLAFEDLRKDQDNG